MAQRKKAAKNQAPMKSGAKKAFILAQPSTMTARELTQRAKDQGFEISQSYVSIVRGARRSAAGRRFRAGATRGRSTESTRSMPPDFSAMEAQLRRIVLEIGVGRARQVLNDFERQLRRLLERG